MRVTEIYITPSKCILIIVHVCYLYILCTYISPYCNSMPIRSCILDIAPSRPRAVPDSPNISPGPRGMTSISLSTYSVRHKQEALPSLLEDTVPMWWMLRDNPINFSLYIPLYIYTSYLIICYPIDETPSPNKMQKNHVTMCIACPR